VGFLDWLFGRRKDRYGRGLPKTPGAAHRASELAPPKAFGGPPPPPPKPGWYADQFCELEPFVGRYSPRHERPAWVYAQPKATLFWRRQRSVKEVEGEGSAGSPKRVLTLGLASLPGREQLAAFLHIPLNDLMQYVARPNGANQHYVVSYIPKASGGRRLILAPKQRLRSLQRSLLRQLISSLPLNHAVHGFRPGRSTLSGASVHVRKAVVISVDNEDFFPSFDICRVAGYFRAIGYSGEIAQHIANLTTVTPDDVPGAVADWCRDLPLLPQGAPTSPGIANAICWRMDKRLSALARKFGGEYTRYADDLTFSGGEEMSRGAGRLLQIVRKIVKTEGLQLNEKKTRIMRRNRQQRVTGIVVNEKPNIPRRDYDQLKAILHNCIKQGPESQNREQHPDFKGHLQGRVAYVTQIAPERGTKLKAMFDRISW
jgi:retron-type reverse transcriptase